MNKRGFTLIEFLTYIAIGSIVTLFIGSFIISVFNTRDKSKAVASVEEQGRSAMQVILQSIRNSDTVSAPAVGLSSSMLNLSFVSSTLNPTVFNLSSSTITVSEGGAASLSLITPPVIVTALNFSNISYVGTPGAVRVQFTLKNYNPNNRNAFQYQKTFYGTASLR